MLRHSPTTPAARCRKEPTRQGRVTGKVMDSAEAGLAFRARRGHIRTQHLVAVSHSSARTTKGEKMAKTTQHLEGQQAATGRAERKAK